jgi:hypothetical protein
MRGALTLLFVAFTAACGARGEAGEIQPGLEQQLIGASQPSANRFLVFEWSLSEGASRFSGAGAARVSMDRRARLDLFGPQDIPYLSAILRDDRVSLPPGVPGRIIPPAPLLWSAFGVIRPPTGAELIAAEANGDEARLAYRAEDGVWTFDVRAGVLVGAEWRASNGDRHTVELTGAAAGRPPVRAMYRDWQEYRELVLELEQQEDVDAFPPETWSLESR